ncbi:MAG: hypothetical protein SFV52_10790 [Saprospiraceae bacterium]|nr:hypothetical protein [Saprospiraceae bacterium]
MQEPFASLRFRDIMETNVLYYDKSHEDILKKIAGSLNITIFARIVGENLYKYKDDKFKRDIIDRAIRLDALEPIFDVCIVRKFQSHDDVLFVYSGNDNNLRILEGVVHISDYNRNIVIDAIQSDVLDFERDVRRLLILENKTNKDLWENLLQSLKKTKDNFYQQHKDKYHEFQIFYIDEILHYLKQIKSGINIPEEDIKKVVNLRNAAMHGKNTIKYDSQNNNDSTARNEVSFLFNAEDLKELFSDMNMIYNLHINVLQEIEQSTMMKYKEKRNEFNLNYIESISKENKILLSHLISNT